MRLFFYVESVYRYRKRPACGIYELPNSTYDGRKRDACGSGEDKQQQGFVRFPPLGGAGRGLVNMHGAYTHPYHFTNSRTPPKGGN